MPKKNDDNTSKDPQTTAVPTEPTTPPTNDKPDEPLGDGGKSALVAERKLRADAEKTAADALAQVKVFEDKNKSDLERATDEAATAKTDLENLQAENLRLRIGKGLPEHLQQFLTGTTEEALIEQVRTLLDATSKAGEPRRPVPDHSQGAKQTVDSAPKQVSEVEANRMSPSEIAKAHEDGQFDDLMAGKS